MNAYKCLEWVKAHGSRLIGDMRTSLSVVEWLADSAKNACSEQWEVDLCDSVKAFHTEQLASMRSNNQHAARAA